MGVTLDYCGRQVGDRDVESKPDERKRARNEDGIVSPRRAVNAKAGVTQW